MSLPNQADAENEAMHMAVVDFAHDCGLPHHKVNQEMLHVMIDDPTKRTEEWKPFEEYLEDYLSDLSQS